MTKADRGDAWFRKAVDNAVCELVHRDFYPYEASISLPVFYPNGDSVVVDVRPSNGGFYVTDSGATYQEIESIGAASFFTRNASRCAESAAINYNDQAFCIDDVSEAALSSAIVRVADCSRRAYEIAYEKLCAKKYEEASDALYERLVSVFGESKVVPDAKIAGASRHEWEVDAIVTTELGQALFEFVAKRNQTSYTPVVAKFHDIARLDNPPTRVSVVSSFEEMGDVTALLQQASTVVEITASDDRIATAATLLSS